MKKTSSFKSEYKYGFAMPEKYEYKSKRGLNEDTIRDISKMKGEPDWMLQFRLASYKVFKAKKMPSFGGDLSKIDFDNLFYYIKSTKGSSRKWSDLPPEIKETYDRLGIPEAEKALLAGVKAQYESEVVYGSLLKDLSDKGVIFTDTDTALKKYPDLFRKYFATVIPPGDNKFSALNSAVWSGGSFIYVPKNVHIDLPLQTYFRINSSSMGQFERTLIIVDEGASVTYAEGCHKGGSKVHTIEGLKNIEDIKIGDFVLTHKGRFKQVTNTIKRPYKGKIYNLRLEGDGNSHLKVTEEHPFLYSRRRVQEYKNKEFKKEWRPISGIRKYDYLMMPVRKSDFEAEAMGRTIPFGKNGFQKLKINIPLDEKFFKLLGYFYAEGTVQDEHYLSFTFHKDEQEYIDEVTMLIEEIFHKSPFRENVRLNGQTIRLSSTLASRFIAQEFGSTLKTKHIPEYLFHANKKALSALICGMWNGDGSYDKKAHMFRYNSISSNLAYGYRDILSILGIKSIIFKTKRSGNRHDMYTVTIVRSDNHLFSKIVGIESQNGILLRSSSHLDKDYSYFCIKSIKITEEETEVYNLSVEEDESYVCEGVISHNCSSPVYSEDSLHSAVVEIIALKGARVRYLTVQNWFNDVYNLVTKRAVAHENAIVEWIDGNIGSKVTMKYPSVILKGKGAHGEVLSLAMSKGGQHQDTGGKMIHLASNTSSIITSKSISLGGGRTSYRGLVKVAKDAKNCKVKVNCDALILDPLSRSDTYPYMEINNKNVSISHEATVSKLDKSQIFYLMSKGLSEEEASAMIVSGFIEPIVKHLPMEYAVELNRLIDMEMEGSVG